MTKKMLTFTALVAVALAGCSSLGGPADRASQPEALLEAVNAASDGLARQIRRVPLEAPLIVASAQNNDRLSEVCSEGRLIADMVSSRLTQKGLPVTEVRLTQQLRVSAEGETLLSREVGELAENKMADAVVTATWTTVKAANGDLARPTARKRYATYVTLKAVRIADGLTLGSQTFAAPQPWLCR